MYNKLRWRFILLSLVIITGILVSLFLGINIADFYSNRKQADEILSSYVVKIDQMQNGLLPPEEFQEFFTADQFRYRDENYFITTKIDDENYFVRSAFMGSVSQEQGIDFFEKALNRDSEKGYVEGFRYLKSENTIYFLDCRHFFDSQKDFFFLSSMFSMGGIVVFFICLYFGSYLIFKNVKTNEKNQKEFITNASHQLKTPLMVISANNDLIEIKNGESEETKTIFEQIGEMNSMVSNLLTISRASEAKNKEQTNICLSNVLYESINMFKPIFSRQNINISAEIDDNANVLSDDYSVNEIIKIILENASKYAKSTIKVSLRKTRRYIELIEENDSDFTKNEDLNYLTGRFVRGEVNAHSRSGSGIGLFMLKALLDSHKSSLHIYSKDGNFILKIKFKSN